MMLPCHSSRAPRVVSGKPAVSAPLVTEPDIVWMTVGKDRVPVMVFYPELLASSRPCMPASMIGETACFYCATSLSLGPDSRGKQSGLLQIVFCHYTASPYILGAGTVIARCTCTL